MSPTCALFGPSAWFSRVAASPSPIQLDPPSLGAANSEAFEDHRESSNEGREESTHEEQHDSKSVVVIQFAGPLTERHDYTREAGEPDSELDKHCQI